MTEERATRDEFGSLGVWVWLGDTRQDTLQFRTLKRRTEDTFKAHAHTRTDQFAVAKQLEGLQEKFQVLSRDELADALRARLTELDQHRSPWFPEILSLLLQLADHPAQFSKVDQVARPKLREEVKPLVWNQLDAAGSAYCEEDIWESVDFGADSSDDDLSSISTDSYRTRNETQTSIDIEDDYVIPEELFTSGEDDELMNLIKRAQFWNSAENPVADQGEPSSRVITELQVIRETVFMLQGLPTSLFWRLDGRVEISRRYAVAKLSNVTFLSLLRALSSIGTKLDLVRQFNKLPQTIPYMQTFHRGVESHLSRFDTFLSSVQLQLLSRASTVSASLLQVFEDVRRESRLLLMLSELVSSLVSDVSGSSMRCLDLMYDLICLTQATGDDDGFINLAELFFSCFDVYSRPIRLWMETGQLEASPGNELFILENRNHGDLRTLWHDWYTLDAASRLLEAPKFIHPIAHKIFITGKSMMFLRHLNMSEIEETISMSSLTFEDVLPAGSASFCLPFSILLETAFGRMVDKNHSYASALLRKELDQQCGLWRSLEALEYIYLCKDMSIFGPIDSKIFDLIDRGKGAWSDRFLLTELAQSSFDILPLVDPSRLIVRTNQDAHIDTSSRNRSVKILNAISFDYILPWPVANIITKDAISGYQRISTFLMQIRRAKQTIVKQRLQHNNQSDKIQDTRNNTLSYALRHNMIWFLNALYSHMTDFVVSTATASLRKTLSASADVDAMIAAHHSYMSSLQEQCLLSANLHPLHKATITILDLCVCFADIQTSRYGDNHLDHARTASKGMKGLNRGAAYDDDEQSDDEDKEEDESDIDDDKLAASFHETHYLQRVRDIKDQFDRLVSFMVAGLRGVGRVDGQISWEILAEKLEWRKAGGQQGL
ncbi:gamma-tubulin complex component GCP5 [Aspergillus heteromorphus CBS 117.55]|uniref:Spindle pole body component n=1 Tax=Aspergillus heteromorphus CBS 117.55 TaxID=1448321 RepID=A0A317X3Q5_9EURO|nr:gamma-tubulin complex component GCP5 [Aspergillus heteromorphus CBS 117.55]PWY92137.1 gamma-tubulin complex component GCP5 [Aspergillus heteromorphus CBS 117.55]